MRDLVVQSAAGSTGAAAKGIVALLYAAVEKQCTKPSVGSGQGAVAGVVHAQPRIWLGAVPIIRAM